MIRTAIAATLASTLLVLPFATQGYNPKDADARHCLDQPTNQQIIKCAERYLNR